MVLDRFVLWLKSAASGEKIEAIADVVETFRDAEQGSKERAACERLFALFVTDPDANVRQRLATQVADVPDLPKALVWNLLQDEPAIAAPLYAQSKHLCERTLLAGVEEGGDVIQTAIAGRSGLSGDIVCALVAKGTASAIARILENEEIVLGPVLKHDIATAHGNDARVRDLLLNTEDLAPHTRQLLVRGLSTSLAAFVSGTGWCDSKRLNTVTNDAANRATLTIAGDCLSDTKDKGCDAMVLYVDHLRATSQLTPALILRSICAGHGTFFEAALANLSGMSLKRVQAIIDDGRSSAFRALYARTNLPEKAFNVFRSSISVWQKLQREFEWSTVSESELYAAAVEQIVEQAQDDPTTEPSLMAMLHRMLAEATREHFRDEHHIKLLAPPMAA
ncbi:DUF2336 domain-containing protein [Pseudahrensia aquimaris]|uniref:DUF2336 domain-containing protein n=1 Tax=Pseudahrensia aquimaris TaxID=744461 RepID=A0ABW3FAV9_9HYPH